MANALGMGRGAQRTECSEELYGARRKDALWGLPRDEVLWPPQDSSGVADEWSAARYCIDLVRGSRGLRRRFPRALSGGAQGAFARWLIQGGAGSPRLGAQARQAIARAFDADLAMPVQNIYGVRADVRESHPLALTPAGLAEFVPWLFRHGVPEHRLRPEMIWWFALCAAEDPAGGLTLCFLFNPAWQRAVPDGLTVFGRRELAAWLAAEYRIGASWLEPTGWPVSMTPGQQIRLAYGRREEWQAVHPRPFSSPASATGFVRWLASGEAGLTEEAQAWCAQLDIADVARELADGGVNILGHFCYASGLRTSVEAISEGLRRKGVRLALRDVAVDQATDEVRHVACRDLEYYDATIIHVQPEPFLEAAYSRASLGGRGKAPYRIGYWYWELDEVPGRWLAQQSRVDEIWTASTFVADALRAKFTVPVHVLPPGIELPHRPRSSRKEFGLEDREFVFLFTFHMTSNVERKNPIGLIRAFRQAFGHDSRFRLVLKTSFGAEYPEGLRTLQDAADGRGVTIIDAIYDYNRTLALMAACDCYVSLHRSEGFGLTMAEAMLLEKPVIATGYSGNLEFMNHGNSLLVDYELVPIRHEIPPYPAGGQWAEPSISHAADLMRRVVRDPDQMRGLGARGAADLKRHLSVEAAGCRMAKRLEAIKASLAV